MKDGNAAFVRDGKTYESGLFGGGLLEGVRGNPEAEAHARAYRNLNLGGFMAVLGGGLSAASGAVLVGSSANGSEPADRTNRAVGEVMLVSGLAAYVAGLILIVNAPPHVFDAANVYNDGLPPESFQAPRVAPTYAPPRAPAPATPAPVAPAAPTVTAPNETLPAPPAPPPE
jgi:hypothetical protein